MTRFGTARSHSAILVALLLGGADLLAAEGPPAKPPAVRRLPVLAWLGPPAEQSNVERMRELAEAGFTESFSQYPTVDSARAALDAAQTAGVKLWLALPSLRHDPEATARQLQNHPALAGYFLADEPNADQFEMLSAWAARLRAVDAVHPSYVNLFPNYASPEQTRAKDYRDYVERFVRDVPALPISFDYYPIVGDRLRDGWYENLQLIADVAHAARRPFWAFALSVAHDPYPVPTAAQLRLQVYSNLAYGAQTIQYFTYWTPPENPTWNFHSAPIDRQGNRTLVYDRVKEVNAELKNLSEVFRGSSVEGVGHTGRELPPGTTRYRPTWPVDELAAESGAVVSHLAAGDRRYLMVVNRDFRQSMDLVVKFDPTVAVSLVTKEGQLHPIEAKPFQATLTAGDAAIFAWDLAGKAANPTGGTP
ncbi:MAG TPA: beta-galactosidase [Pirellulales bacterium]|jgi:hypothetical protein|nr:beta-galactosidase [Pirellulales bacterium]